MNKQERERYKKILLERKQELKHQLSEFYSESKEVETGIVQDFGDEAESSYTKEFLLSLSDTERKKLALIDQALKRVETAEFSICQSCGVKISKKRLNVVPWAALCIVCQQKEEEEAS
ncbi:MAG: TraR/DksA family transcriptional regulator [Candidatus Aminicenantaceae bacterium]